MIENQKKLRRYYHLQYIARNNMLFALSVLFIWFSHLDFLKSIVSDSFLTKSAANVSHIFIDLAIIYVLISTGLILAYIITHFVLVLKKIIPKTNRYSQLMVIELLFFLLVVVPIIIVLIAKQISPNELIYTIPIIDIFAIFPLICHYAFVNVDTHPNNINASTLSKNMRLNMIGDQLLLIVAGCIFAIFIHFNIYQDLFVSMFTSFKQHNISSIIHLITVFIPFVFVIIGHILLTTLIIYSLRKIHSQSLLQKKIILIRLIAIAAITISIVTAATVTFWYDDSQYSYAILGIYDFVFVLMTTMTYLFVNGSNIVKYRKNG